MGEGSTLVKINIYLLLQRRRLPTRALSTSRMFGFGSVGGRHQCWGADGRNHRVPHGVYLHGELFFWWGASDILVWSFSRKTEIQFCRLSVSLLSRGEMGAPGETWHCTWGYPVLGNEYSLRNALFTSLS